jgi:hypothetical protein
MFLVDANVLSEATKSEPDSSVSNGWRAMKGRSLSILSSSARSASASFC